MIKMRQTSESLDARIRRVFHMRGRLVMLDLRVLYLSIYHLSTFLPTYLPTYLCINPSILVAGGPEMDLS